MNAEDLIQYVPEKTLLIGLQLKSRAFLQIRERYIDQCAQMTTIYNSPHASSLLPTYNITEKAKCNNLLSLNISIEILRKGFPDEIPKYYWMYGLNGACYGGHLDLAEWMISKGAINLGSGLYVACQYNHREVVKLLISKGMNKWNKGLSGACRGDSIAHEALIKLMISCGADSCFRCGRSIYWHWDKESSDGVNWIKINLARILFRFNDLKKMTSDLIHDSIQYVSQKILLIV